MSRQPQQLEQWECESLLRAHVVGRVGLVAADGPHVLPVNYSVVDDGIIFRTEPYSLLGGCRGTVVAFEIDHFDHERQRGWSVLARGPAEAVESRTELAHIESVWPPQSWASGSRPLHIRIRWTSLSGRKLGGGWDPATSDPVHRTL